MGGTMGSSLPPFQTSMTSSLGHTGISPAMDTQKSSGLFGVENKTTTNISGSNAFKTSDPFSSGGSGIHSMDPSAGIRMLHEWGVRSTNLKAYRRRIKAWNTGPYKHIHTPLIFCHFKTKFVYFEFVLFRWGMFQEVLVYGHVLVGLLLYHSLFILRWWIQTLGYCFKLTNPELSFVNMFLFSHYFLFYSEIKLLTSGLCLPARWPLK